MPDQLKIGCVSWIHAEPNPISLAGSLDALIWKPEWLPKTVIGLVATANSPPSPRIKDFEHFRSSQNFRSLTYVDLSVNIDRSTRSPHSVEIRRQSFYDGGWTPPFNRWKFWMAAIKPEDENILHMSKDNITLDKDIQDRSFHPGQTSSISKISKGVRHPNSAITPDKKDETIIFDAITKFRAGPHTDEVGIKKVKCPNHVPWVWSETMLTLRKDGNYCLYCLGSKFPTHSWYVNGELVGTQNEITDKSFPTDGREILVKSLKLHEALVAGAPAAGPQSPKNETQKGPVSRHPYTLSGVSLPQQHTWKALG